jgi:hypothetical protein
MHTSRYIFLPFSCLMSLRAWIIDFHFWTSLIILTLLKISNCQVVVLRDFNAIALLPKLGSLMNDPVFFHSNP